MPPSLAWQRETFQSSSVSYWEVEWPSWRRGWQYVKGYWLCGCGFVPLTQQVGCVVVVGVWWNVTDIIVCLLVLYSIYCLWTSGGLPVISQNSLENGHPWGTEWCCCGCVSLLVQLPVHWMHTSALAATQLPQMWLNESGWVSFTSWMSLIGHLCQLVSLTSLWRLLHSSGAS